MLDYGPYYVLFKLKKLKQQMAYALGAISYLLKVINGGGAGGSTFIIRDAPTFPVEPNPPNTAIYVYCAFRDGSRALLWDKDNQVWL